MSDHDPDEFEKPPQQQDNPDAPAEVVVIKKKRSLLHRLVLWLGFALLMLVSLAVALGLWLRSSVGTQWTLKWVPGLEVIQPQGALLGDFQAYGIVYQAHGIRLKIDKLAWVGLHWERVPEAPLGWGLAIKSLEANRVEIQLENSSSASNQPLQLPASIALPLGVHIDNWHMKEVYASFLGSDPIHDWRASVALQHRHAGQVQHRLDNIALQWQQWRANGAISLGVLSPYSIQAQLKLKQSLSPQRADEQAHIAAQPLTAQVDLTGNLKRLAAQLQAQVGGQHLQAQAELAWFEPQPWLSLDAQAQDFNLAVLDARLPRTALNGYIHIKPPSLPKSLTAKSTTPLVQQSVLAPPLSVHLVWRNTDPGRWSEQKLPIQSIDLQGQFSFADGLFVQLQRLAIALYGRRDAGHIHATGQADFRACRQTSGCVAGHAERWQFQADLERVQLAELDERAPSLMLSGPLNLQGQRQWDQGLGIEAHLTGQVLGGKLNQQEVTLQTQVKLTPQALQIEVLRAQAGKTQLNLTGQVRHHDHDWHLVSQGQWSQFDPQLWWPGGFIAARQYSALKSSAANELNGQLDIDLQWRDQPGAQLAWDSVLQTLKGRADVRLTASRLLGVALAGQISLQEQGARGAKALKAVLDLAGNQVRLDGVWDLSAQQSDQWVLALAGPQLQNLAPLASLAGVYQLAGQVDGKLQGLGRWPHMTTSGTVTAQGLKWAWTPTSGGGAAANQLALTQLTAQWQWGAIWADARAVTQTQLQVAGLQVAGWQVDDLKFQLTGNLAEHQFQLGLQALLPAALAQALQPALQRRAPQTPLKIAAQLEANGHLTRLAAEAGWAWQSQWRSWVVRPEAASVEGNSLGNQPWLQIEPFELAIRKGLTATELHMSPTKIALLGANITLKQLQWAQMSTARLPNFDVDLSLEPVQIAKILAVLQPQMGWQGDLAVGGKLSAHQQALTPLALDMELARVQGDLALGAETKEKNLSQYSLGLEDLRLKLKASQNSWQLEQVIKGKHLGSLVGQQMLRTESNQPWPTQQSSVDGKLDLQIADLRLWNPWLSAGWQMAGRLNGQMKITGTLGQPLFAGQIQGRQLAVGNFFEGMEFDRGELDLTLKDQQAQLNNFSLRGGAGSLRLTGTAHLSQEPEAELHLALDQFALLQRLDRRLIMSGQADAKFLKKQIDAHGKLTVDAGQIDISKASDTPTLDSDVQVIGRDDKALQIDPSKGGDATQALQVNLDLALDLGSKLRVKGYGLDSRLAGQLKLTTPAPTYKPSLEGTIHTEDGTVAAYGQKLIIDHGNIQFTGAPTNPSLDILATREREGGAMSDPSLTATTQDTEVKVGIAVTGSAQNPRIRLYSDPEMSDTDKLSWLVLGHAANGLGGADLALLQAAASALMSGDTSGSHQGLFKSLGLDQVALRQSKGSGETVLSVGKQLSKRWYVGYEVGLNKAVGTWQIIYRLAQRFTLRAQSGADTSLDLIWSWRWN